PESVDARDVSDALAACIRTGRFAEFCERIHNDFDTVIRRAQPDVGRAHDRLLAAGAEATILCGSGTAVAGFFRSVQDAKASVDSFRLKPGEWVTVAGFTGVE